VSEKRPGDPDGRRLAKERAIRLAEAGRLANVLEVMARRAGFDTALIGEVSRQLTREEQHELLKAHGRIESRQRFKITSPPPPHDARVHDLLFIDESGKPDFRSSDPVFALAGISMTEEEVREYNQRVNEVKQRFFQHADFTLHEPNIRRHEQHYSFGGDTARRQEFCTALDEVVAGVPFRAFGVAIRKAEFRGLIESGTDRYLPRDRYSVAIHLLLERYVDYLSSRTPGRCLGRVTFESQGPRENAEHQRDYVELLLNGTQWVPDSAFRHWLETGVRFTKKQGTEPMELADMFSRDVFEWARDGCVHNPRRWASFDDKIYRRDDMAMGKFGVKVFPDSDLRQAIEAHRERCGRPPGILESN
jgi:Protein of unknown function (DUF3800)